MEDRVVLEDEGAGQAAPCDFRVSLGVAQCAAHLARPELTALGGQGSSRIVKARIPDDLGSSHGVQEFVLDAEPLELLAHGSPSIRCLGQADYKSARSLPAFFLEFFVLEPEALELGLAAREDVEYPRQLVFQSRNPVR